MRFNSSFFTALLEHVGNLIIELQTCLSLRTRRQVPLFRLCVVVKILIMLRHNSVFYALPTKVRRQASLIKKLTIFALKINSPTCSYNCFAFSSNQTLNKRGFISFIFSITISLGLPLSKSVQALEKFRYAICRFSLMVVLLR